MVIGNRHKLITVNYKINYQSVMLNLRNLLGYGIFGEKLQSTRGDLVDEE